MKTWILLFFCFFTTHIAAQKIDSLWMEYQKPEKDTISRIKILHRIARLYMQSDLDSAWKVANMEFDMAASINNYDWMASALNSQGSVLTMQGEYAKGLDKFYRMLEIRMEMNDTNGISVAYNNIGNIYYYKGDYSKALQNFIQSLHYEELFPTNDGLATSYLNIGSVYALQEDFHSALRYFKKAVASYELYKDENGIASAYTNMATAYKSLDSFDLALQFFNKAIPLLVKTGDEPNLAIAYLNMADAFRRLGDRKAMLEHYAKSESLRNKNKDQLGLAMVWISRGMAYALEGNYKAGKQDCERGLATAESMKAMFEVKTACDCLYEVYKGLGNNDKALAFFERHAKLRDSLEQDETLLELQVMEFRKEVAKDSLLREEEKAAIALEHKKELKKGSQLRNILITLGLGLGFVSVLFYRNYNKARKSKLAILKEKRKSDQVLLNILPASIAEELKRTGKVDAQEFDNVTILFTDFVGFTKASEKIRPQELVKELNLIYSEFDEISSRYGVEKIKNIGDAYMAAGGLPQSTEVSVRNTVLAALFMQEYLKRRQEERKAAGLPMFEMRVGIHTGPVVAGIIGVKKFQYDVWGDTVNTANRMETNCIPGKVNISNTTYQYIQHDPDFIFTRREVTEVKGKGEMQMYFVELK